MKKEWSKISLIFLFLVALIGTLLRSNVYINIPLEYANLVHTHSHVAFQGWVYTLIFLLLSHQYLEKKSIIKGRYILQFKLTIVTIIGILISFSLQGYALFSIIFSTLFQFLNYWFIYRFLVDTKTTNLSINKTISIKFIKTGLWLGVLSTIMPYGIGILSAKGLGNTEAYKSFVYTFMHLQYNGWFLFVALGLFYKFLEKNNVSFNHRYAEIFYWCFTIAVIPAIALSLLGMSFSKYITIAAYFASILQALGLFFFLRCLDTTLFETIKQKHKWLQLFLGVFFISFILKTVIQSLSVLPVFWKFAFSNKLVLLAYLHLSLIGVITSLFMALLFELKWLTISWLSKFGSLIFVIGFIATEAILALGGLHLFYNQTLLIIGSILMTLSILFLILSMQKQVK